MKKLSERITPGPWKREDNFVYKLYVPYSRGTGRNRFHLKFTRDYSASSEVGDEEMTANATATQYVPEMLSILERLADYGEHEQSIHDLISEASQLVKKLNS